MFFFFLINGADKTNKAKCGQNKAELFPAFDSLAGKVPIRTQLFLQNPYALLSNSVFEAELHKLAARPGAHEFINDHGWRGTLRLAKSLGCQWGCH